MWMTKNFLNSSSLMIIKMAFTISKMNRIGDRTETSQYGSQQGPVISERSWLASPDMSSHIGTGFVSRSNLYTQMQKSSVVRYIHGKQWPINDVNGYAHHTRIVPQHAYTNTYNYNILFKFRFYSIYFWNLYPLLCMQACMLATLNSIIIIIIKAMDRFISRY